MKIYSFILPFLFISLASLTGRDPIEIDKQEAQNAFGLLQQIRARPNDYSKELDFPANLKVASLQLKWNDTLAAAAEAKAFDMANRNYFAHIDPDGKGMNYHIQQKGYSLLSSWTSNKSDNYFESISANNSTGIDAIKSLIKDSQTPSLGHRKHLLGLDEWNASLSDIGIGFARRESGSTYQTYICVLIAKHSW